MRTFRSTLGIVPVLVTGATGLLGNNVVRVLLREGREVRVLVREGSDPRPLEGLEVDEMRGDVRDTRAVDRAVHAMDVVIHAAARVHVGRRGLAELRRVNVGGTVRVARACRLAGARLVHVSSVDALGFGTREEPATETTPPRRDLRIPYVTTKREAEAVVLDEVREGLDAVLVNPAYLLGPRDWKPSSGRILLEVARGLARVAPPGGNDFCHVEDVARGVVEAAERGRRGERYILGGESLSYREAFELFARVTGGPRPRWTAPRGLVRLAGAVADVAGRLRGSEPAFNGATAHMACLPHHFSSRKARDELGYRSRSAETAARDAWAWFRAHGYA